jgi:hypothetical protein
MERGAFVLMDVAGDTRLAELAQSPREVSTSPSTFSAVLDALLTTVPAPVLAKLLDRRPWRMADRSKILGTDWRRYVVLRVQS